MHRTVIDNIVDKEEKKLAWPMNIFSQRVNRCFCFFMGK